MNKQNKDGEHIDRLFSLLNIKPDGKAQSSDTAQYDRAALTLRKFISEIPGGFFIYRASDGSVLYVNDALLDIYRCNTRAEFEALTGNTFTGMIHPDDVDNVKKAIASQITGKQDDLDYVEYRIIRKDGSIRWVEDYGHFVHDVDGGGDIFYVFVSDATDKITRRLSLIASEHEKEHQLQTLIEEYDKERKLIRQEHLQRLEVIEGLSVNYESICYVDLDDDNILPYRISTRLVKQFENKLQPKSLGWFLKDYNATWVHPNDRKKFKERTSPEYIRDTLTKTDTYYLNYRCIENGETKYIQLRIVNVGEKSHIQRLVLGFRKVDDEIMQEMKQKQLLETALSTAKLADKAKNTFLSNMSHDMRTPLNAIFGYTELARKKADCPDSVRDYLDKIERSGRQMLALVEKVLDFSYVKSSDSPAELAACSLYSILGDVESTISHRAEAKKIDFKLQTRVTHDVVLADADKLKQLLVNLADNAVKYTQNGGRVRVTTEESDEQKEYSTFTFAVTDNGIGISENGLKRIFDPFERDTNTTMSGEFGTGLGLTIVKHLTDSMGGTIDIASELGKGSIFTVKFTFKRPDKTIPVEQPKHDHCAGKHILLVDDNDINLDVETEILQDLGFDVDVAENGQIAVEKVKNSPRGRYDLILMDIQMPVMDGREATRAIRALSDPALAQIPIVALSANAFDSDKRESIACGMDAHLPKPIDEALLLDTISKVTK